MESNINIELAEQGSPEVPSLIKYISSNELEGFDTGDCQFPRPSAKVRYILNTLPTKLHILLVENLFPELNFFYAMQDL